MEWASKTEPREMRVQQAIRWEEDHPEAASSAGADGRKSSRWGGLPELRGRRGNVPSVGLPPGGDELGVAEAADGTGEGEDPTEGACGRAGGGPEHPEVASRRSLRSLSWRRSRVKHVQEALGGFQRPGEPRNRARTLNASPREYETERGQSWWRSRPNCAPNARGSRIEASGFG